MEEGRRRSRAGTHADVIMVMPAMIVMIIEFPRSSEVPWRSSEVPRRLRAAPLKARSPAAKNKDCPQSHAWRPLVSWRAAPRKRNLARAPLPQLATA